MSHQNRTTRSATSMLALILPLALASVAAVPAWADTAKPATSAEAAQRSALQNELRRQLVAKRIPSAGVERTLAQLDGLSMAQLRELADFAGARDAGAGRLIAGAPAQAGRDRAGDIVGSSGSSSSATSGSGMQRGIAGAMDPRNGINDTRGQTSYGADTCAACPDTKSGREAAKYDATGDGPKKIETQSGHTIKIYGDGSASIAGADGKTEYLNSGGRIVDRSNNAVPNATPRPDDQSPTTSTRITQNDIDRINGVLGNRAKPNPNDTGSTGGPVDAGKADRTGSLGLFTDNRPGAGYVSKADMQEIIRVSIEKLQGPQVGN